MARIARSLSLVLALAGTSCSVDEIYDVFGCTVPAQGSGIIFEDGKPISVVEPGFHVLATNQTCEIVLTKHLHMSKYTKPMVAGECIEVQWQIVDPLKYYPHSEEEVEVSQEKALMLYAIKNGGKLSYGNADQERKRLIKEEVGRASEPYGVTVTRIVFR